MPELTPEQFAADLLAASAATPKAVARVVSKGSLNVKNDARRNVLQTAPRRNAHAHLAIDYDLTTQGATAVGEIGYNKDHPTAGKSAKLGNLLEFGGGGDHSPPHHDLARALEVEEPRFVQALTDVVEDALK